MALYISYFMSKNSTLVLVLIVSYSTINKVFFLNLFLYPLAIKENDFHADVFTPSLKKMKHRLIGNDFLNAVVGSATTLHVIGALWGVPLFSIRYSIT